MYLTRGQQLTESTNILGYNIVLTHCFNSFNLIIYIVVAINSATMMEKISGILALTVASLPIVMASNNITIQAGANAAP